MMQPVVVKPASPKNQRINVAFQEPATLKAAPPERLRAGYKADDCGHGIRARTQKEMKATP